MCVVAFLCVCVACGLCLIDSHLRYVWGCCCVMLLVQLRVPIVARVSLCVVFFLFLYVQRVVLPELFVVCPHCLFPPGPSPV